MKVEDLLARLREEPLNTWFDLGLFIDRFREERAVPSAEFHGFYEDFREALLKGGMAFVSFEFGIDGVTVEALKYARCFEQCLSGMPIHFVAGEFRPAGTHLFEPSYVRHTIPEMNGFDKWPLHRDFFLIKLERGSREYNALIRAFWKEVLLIVEKLGAVIEKNGIGLLYLLNVNSNPGNVSLALAVVFLSEALGIPVINNNHDFYWEGGNREIDIVNKGLRRGPRDYFFTNSDVGEFFSIIEMLYPWESRSWLQVNINRNQCRRLIEVKGHNPANVAEISTAVDVEAFQGVSRQRKTAALLAIADALGGYSGKLPVYSPREYLELLPSRPGPVVVGAETNPDFDFARNNIIFLQPTRIMVRKRIQVGFKLLDRLLGKTDFKDRFESNPLLSVTLLVTGPVAAGHEGYLVSLVEEFGRLQERVPEAFRGRVFLALLFSEFDKKSFIERYGRPLSIPEIYSIASLILLPSETEGRGLPIIEAAASGVPIFCHRYHPRRVYKEVIGTHLEEQDRLRVFEFKGKRIGKKIASKISEWVFFPQDFLEDVSHNLAAVKKRYSMDSLRESIGELVLMLYHQLKPNAFSLQRIMDTLQDYQTGMETDPELLAPLLETENRCYLPGYGRLAFMHMLKSLIDPSYFRVEEQRIRGMGMGFAMRLVEESGSAGMSKQPQVTRFYNAVDNLFLCRLGEIGIRHDHSLAYRHRNKIHYGWQDFTFQELTGLINLLFGKIVDVKAEPIYETVPHHFSDRRLALLQLTNSADLAIDDRDRLLTYLGRRVPLALFLGDSMKHELDFFALQYIRDQLGIGFHEALSAAALSGESRRAAAVSVFCPEKPMGRRVAADALDHYIRARGDPEIRLLLEQGLLRIVRTQQWCVGVHLQQLGCEALRELAAIKQAGGCLVAVDDQAALMTDILDMERFHIGRVEDEIGSRIMGIPEGSGFVQYVPAGLRTTLAFPTPVQTALDLHTALKGPLFARLKEAVGERAVLDAVKRDAEEKGSPLKEVLIRLSEQEDPPAAEKPVSYTYVSGVYEDGMPWNGALARAAIGRSEGKWSFAAFTAGAGRRKVTSFVQDFERDTGKRVEIAWNGGYILNAELVGKLGLAETYIGSPLGLIVSEGKILSPPLFNKPAFLVRPDGTLDIRRVSCEKGFSLSAGGKCLDFVIRNPDDPPGDRACFYDLAHPGETIGGRDRIIVRLAGNMVKEIIRTKGSKAVPIIPVGLTLSIPASLFPKEWDALDGEVRIAMNGWEELLYAVEAGPMLVDGGEICIDMQVEGWKSPNSIRTQAARLDFLDMRGPRIAIGLDGRGDLFVLTINGRIRESVGASHTDMAEILIQRRIRKAMGFDPGGSSTLYACGKVLNISPYNGDYEREVIALPPEPRPVGNAVLGWRD